MDNAFDNLAHLQGLVEEKLAEIGIVLAAPISFATQDDVNMIQVAAVWPQPPTADQHDSVSEMSEEDAIFESIVAAEQEAEAERKVKEEEERRAAALREMQNLSQELDLEDDD